VDTAPGSDEHQAPATGCASADLEGGAVHLYALRADSAGGPALARACNRILGRDEQQRGRRFFFASDRLRHLLTRALVRTTLSRYARVSPHAWRFSENDHGRPEVHVPRSARRLRFNVSHSEGLIVVAVAIERAIGVDVERVDPRVPVSGLAQRVFSIAERQALFALPPARRRECFFAYWTLKEAYIKARGLGLALPLQAFTMVCGADDAIGIAFDGLEDDASRWSFHLRRPTREHFLAVAVEKLPRPPASGPSPLRCFTAELVAGPAEARASGPDLTGPGLRLAPIHFAGSGQVGRSRPPPGAASRLAFA